jgi:nucleoside-specific outer membrane channel protein Tsx
MTVQPDQTTLQSCLRSNPRRTRPAAQRPLAHACGLTLAATLVGAASANAADWSSANVQYLYGDDYALVDKSMGILSFEYAAGTKNWDVFFFLDVSNPFDAGTDHYAEFSPRFSSAVFTGKPLAYGIVKDTLLSTTVEMGDGVRAYLVGVGLPLNLPGFAFADFNLYARKSERDFIASQTDTGAQITLAWLLPFKLGPLDMAFEGFADYAWGEDGGSAPKADNLIAAPRLMVDLGKAWGMPGKLQIGVEHQIWRNKFGIDGVDEDVSQAMLKWIF